MPQIKEYTSQVQTQGPVQLPRATPNEYGAGVGQAIGELGGAISHGASLIEKRMAQEEVSDLNVQMSDTHAQFTNKFQQELQDGTLNTDKFLEEFDDHTQKVGEEFYTPEAKRHFNETQAKLREHFTQTVAVGQAELAGAKAKADFNQMKNSQSSALLNDPSSFNLVQQMQDQSIDALVETHGLPAQVSSKLKQEGAAENAKSAVRGWIRLNPDEAQAQLTDGRWDKYFDGDVKKQLYGEIEIAKHAKDADLERQKKAEKDALREQQKVVENDLISKIIDNKATAKEISDNPILDPDQKKTYINWMNQMNKDDSDKIRDQSQVYIDVWDRIHLPDGDPNKITNEKDLNGLLGRGLTLQSIDKFRREIQGMGTEAGRKEAAEKKQLIENAKNLIAKPDKLTGLMDPMGADNFQRWLVDFNDKYSKKRQEGKAADDLLNPDSADYLGKNMRGYLRAPQDIIKDMVNQNRSSGQQGLYGNQVQGEEFVNVVSPDGKTGKIPKSKLNDALKQGFKEKK